jgi:hypothetical protein
MSISDRATRVLSTMLIVVLSTLVGGWTSAERTTRRTCHEQPSQCTPPPSLTCVCCSHSTPADPARLPQTAPRLVASCPLSLMAVVRPVFITFDSRPQALTSPHWHRPLDLSLLHSTLLI